MLREWRQSEQCKRRSLMYLFSEVRRYVLAVNVAVSSGTWAATPSLKCSSFTVTFLVTHSPSQRSLCNTYVE